MNLVLTRTTLGSDSTEGELSVNGTAECVTLELPVRDGLPGSAIPPGKYAVVLVPSPKFELSTDSWVMQYAKEIPRLQGIPNRTNILIHWGNAAKDTDGCILVGMAASEDFISSSRAAFASLWPKLKAAQQAGEAISIEVQGGIPERKNDA